MTSNPLDLRLALSLVSITAHELESACLAYGCNQPLADVLAALGSSRCAVGDHNVMAQVITEHLRESGTPVVVALVRDGRHPCHRFRGRRGRVPRHRGLYAAAVTRCRDRALPPHRWTG